MARGTCHMRVVLASSAFSGCTAQFEDGKKPTAMTSA